MKTNDDQSRIKANFSRAKLLIIDDNDDQWMLIRRAMQECLSEVTPIRASTPEQAIDLLSDWQFQEWEIPKLILLDLYLPDSQEGWGLLRQIKTMPSPFNHIPIVMFSSSSSAEDISTAYQLGVSSYVVKPTDFKDWLSYFQEIRSYWWETITLPPIQYTF
ncbi:response regulator [Spirosoma pollinicola]|uniref:Response regulator n=1 Tax=Spirosoma pollinicola TaxID=2057025 RepID=A0A2K8YVY2_9BACT|nr:response regulator [Spirosoma pollinicola]AUD01800.1 response regulator [Spirosoma pollinicola]